MEWASFSLLALNDFLGLLLFHSLVASQSWCTYALSIVQILVVRTLVLNLYRRHSMHHHPCRFFPTQEEAIGLIATSGSYERRGRLPVDHALGLCL
jgi:hypothetical protein